MKNKNLKSILTLELRITILLVMICLQVVISYFYMNTRPAYESELLILTIVTIVIVPLGFVLSKSITIFLAIMWFTVYSALLFTYNDSKSLFHYSLIFTVPIILILSASVKSIQHRINAAYNLFLNNNRNAKFEIDPYTGYPNKHMLIKILNIFDEKKYTFSNHNYHMFALKISHFDETIERIGDEKYVHYLDENFKYLLRKFDFVRHFYTIEHNFFIARMNYVDSDDMIKISEIIKKQFMENVQIDHSGNLYKIDVQTGFMSENEIEILNIETPDELIKMLYKRAEVDLNGEYF